MATNHDVERDPGNASAEEVNAYLDKIDAAAGAINFQIGRQTMLYQDYSQSPAVRAGIIADVAELTSASDILREKRRAVMSMVLSGVRPPSAELIEITKKVVQALAALTVKSNNAAQALRTAIDALQGATNILTGEVPATPVVAT